MCWWKFDVAPTVSKRSSAEFISHSMFFLSSFTNNLCDLCSRNFLLRILQTCSPTLRQLLLTFLECGVWVKGVWGETALTRQVLSTTTLLITPYDVDTINYQPAFRQNLPELFLNVSIWISLSPCAVVMCYVAVLFRLCMQRVRKPRCCKGPQGLLPRYSSTQADGQEQLFSLTDNIHSEL